jgi:hypothetical protein
MNLMVALVDLVIGLTLLEGAALVVLHRATGRGVAPGDFLLNMASGVLLMLALRCAVHDAGLPSIALCLLAAGLAHAADLSRRWRRGRARDRRAVA